MDLQAFFRAPTRADQDRLLKALVEPEPLVLDDLFLAKRIPDAAAELLQTLVLQRYKQRRSILVMSNRVVQDWGRYYGRRVLLSACLTMSASTPAQRRSYGWQ
ncbi:ATP-binding protein [Paraburkholderia sp. J11-2]|uniref:ATP-binding protein n=1 Tax=Paraburkholderia sp. J11-2 TaxID=2805431 RepID=UPI0039EE78B3